MTLLWALDLGNRMGFAFGEPGARPTSGIVELKQDGELQAVAFSNLLMFLAERWSASRPAVIVKEAPKPLQAYKNMGNGQTAVTSAYGMHAVVGLVCVRLGLPQPRDIAESTVRKHFIGRSRLGTREETKAAVVARCHLLKLMRPDIHDDNQADAIAIHDWASFTIARRIPKKLHLFGETAHGR